MSNNVVAELVTVPIGGDPIRAEVVEVVEVLDYRIGDDRASVDVRLVDGSIFRDVDVLDVAVVFEPRSVAAA